MEKAFRYRIYPSDEQKVLIRKFIGSSRFVYNYFLALRSSMYQETGKGMNYHGASARLTELKQEISWFKEADKFALQNTLRDLEDAYGRFFKKQNKYPRFKKKHGKKQSYRTNFTNGNIQVLTGKIKLPKLGWMDLKESRLFIGKVLGVTVRRLPSDKYYVSICSDVGEIEKLPESPNFVGVDLGLKCFAKLSNGRTIENPKFLKKAEKQIKKYQRRLSRKQKGSRNKEKARIKVAVAHEKVNNQRQDFLQKESTKIINENQVVILEDLAVKNMLKNRKLAKAISEVSWSEFGRMLKYKAKWYGRIYHEVNRFYPSSQLCSCCGYKNDDVKNLAVRFWSCPECKGLHNRDENASKNILQQGLKDLKFE